MQKNSDGLYHLQAMKNKPSSSKTKQLFRKLTLAAAAFWTLGLSQDAAAQSCLVPPADMVAWLPGDGTPQDIKNYAQDLRVIGNVTYSPGAVAQASISTAQRGDLFENQRRQQLHDRFLDETLKSRQLAAGW